MSASRSRVFWRWLFLALVLLLAGWGILSRMHAEHALRDHTEEEATPLVTAMTAMTSQGSEELTLPASIQAWHDAPIYARTNGYLKRWTVDIGDLVQEGQLLAEIDAPELDAQTRQAEADLKTAEANNALAQSTQKRWQALLKTHSVAAQENDEKAGDAAAKAALAASARANRDHMRELSHFKHVVAPFAGKITARNTDLGALITAGNNGGNASTSEQELFHLADASKLRIYVHVPEIYQQALHPGMNVELALAEHPLKRFAANLVRTSGAFDAATRTLLVELNRDNPQDELLPGSYAEAHFHLPTAARGVKLPVGSLIFHGDGLQVALLGADDKVTLKRVVIARDFGKEVEIASGIAPGDRIVLNPPDSLHEGEKVRVSKPKEAMPKKESAPKESAP